MIIYKVNSNSTGDKSLDGVLTLIENTSKKILAKFIIKKGFIFSDYWLWNISAPENEVKYSLKT